MKKVLLAACLAVIFASPAFSQMNMPMGEHRGDPHRGHTGMSSMCDMDRPGEEMGDMMEKCLQHADQVGLSEEQISKVKAIHRDLQKKQARYTADLKIAQIDMKEIMEVKDFDLAKASAQVNKMGEIKTAKHLEMLKAMKSIHTLLTDEQFKKMKNVHMRMEEGKPHRMMMEKK